MRMPHMYNLRSDPFERASEDASMFYDKWKADRAFLLVPAQVIVGEFLKTFKDFPPRQTAGQLQHRPGAREGAAEPARPSPAGGAGRPTVQPLLEDGGGHSQ